MNEIKGINLGDDLPQKPTQDRKPQEQGSPSIFHKLDEDQSHDVDAMELGTYDQLNEALKTLNDIKKTGVTSEDGKNTLDALLKAAKGLLLHKEEYNDSTNFNSLTQNLDCLKSDAKCIKKAAEELKLDEQKGVDAFKNQVYYSAIAANAIETVDKKHNLNAAILQDPKNGRIIELTRQVHQIFKQCIDESFEHENIEDFMKDKISVADAGITDVHVEFQDRYVSGNLKNEYRDNEGKTHRFVDERICRLTCKIDGKKVSFTEVVNIPDGKEGKDGVLKNDRGVEVTYDKERPVRFGNK